MTKKSKSEKISIEKTDISEENGLKISYDREELEEKLPTLMAELSGKKKVIEIDSVSFESETESINVEDEIIKNYCENLSNPGAIDFLRRCHTTDEAIEILDYLLNRNELSPLDYSQIKELIMRENGLNSLIQRCGGFKSRGYYVDKFYRKKDLIDNDLDEDKNLD